MDTEAQLEHLAASQGKKPAQVVEETVTRLLERQATFIAAVERGMDAAKRSAVIGHDEVVARIERLFES
jgi:predicted transcriptional regulator